jgi:hypothetical protein
MTTKAKLAEQILRLYKGGEVSNDNSLSLNEVKLLVGQTINRLLKVELFNVNMAAGDNFPPHAIIASYPDITVLNGSSEYYIILPTMPISLPLNMGVWHISLDDDDQVPFIPIPSSQLGLLKNLPTAAMQGETGYEVNGNKVVFKGRTFTQAEKVLLRLLVVNVDSLSDFDPLPIPADMEGVVIKEVLTLVGAIQVQEDKVSDSNDQA